MWGDSTVRACYEVNESTWGFKTKPADEFTFGNFSAREEIIFVSAEKFFLSAPLQRIVNYFLNTRCGGVGIGVKNLIGCKVPPSKQRERRNTCCEKKGKLLYDYICSEIFHSFIVKLGAMARNTNNQLNVKLFAAPAVGAKHKAMETIHLIVFILSSLPSPPSFSSRPLRIYYWRSRSNL